MKHLDKLLFVICLGFFTWGIIDERYRHLSMVGGYSTLLAAMIAERKRKQLPLFDIGIMLMIICVIMIVGLQIADFIRG